DWVDDYTGSDSITHTYDAHIEQEGIRRLLAAPLLWNNRVLGVIALGSREDGTFGDRSIRRIEKVAERTALAASIADRVDLAKKLAVQDERTRLSADLHDNVGALLYAIGSRVEGIAQMTGSADPELARQLDTLRSHAAEASSALRESLRMLRRSPAGLEVVAALDGDRKAFTERTGIPAELVVVDDPPDLPPSRAEIVVAGAREALLNVEKHAQASAVVVTVVTEPGRVTVAVTDDGIGIVLPIRKGIGLTKTEEAVRRVGGTFEVSSNTSDEGATWRMRLPK
ncbi:histidine kinase, partial [Rhodococcus erythropolis]|uniref:sensor histidine kinase n=1 Tax=Rhodococcus erythropolis TaxID=1833 RepID=UPI00294A7559